MGSSSRLIFQDPRHAPLGSLSLAGVQTGSRGVPARPMRVLGAYAVVLVEAGGGGYRDGNGLCLRVRAGDAILLFPELPHAYGPRLIDARAPIAWNERYVVFSGALFDTLRTAMVLSAANPVVSAPVGWGERLRELVESHQPPTQPAQALGFATLLAELSPQEASKAGSWAESARTALDHDLEAPLDLVAISDAFGLSPDAFRKRFARESGTTPARYRAARRLDAAESLLRNTVLPLKAIAEALGFVDEYHLSHAFKRSRGLPPSALRKGG